MTTDALSLQLERLIAGGSWVSPLTALIAAFVFGQVLAQGTPDEVRNNEKVIEAYLGGAN